MLRRALLVIVLLAVLSTPPFFTQANAQEEEPSVTYSQSGYKGSQYTGFKISSPTQDSGRVDIIFTWELAAHQRGPRGEDLFTDYDTYPTLQMARFSGDGSLDYSLTYLPLYLIQFEDVDGNGVLEVRTPTSSAREVFDDDVNWSLSQDRPLKMYPLAPMLRRVSLGGSSPYIWTWDIGEPTRAKGEIGYDWNISASIQNFGWRFANPIHGVENDSISMRLGYHLSFENEGPTVKLEYGISNANWVSNENVKLALISAVIYHGMDDVIVKDEGKYEGFTGGSAQDRSLALVEKADESIKSMIGYSSDAVVDGVSQPEAVTSSLQPVFIVSTPTDIPETVNIQGVRPGFEDNRSWRYSIAFAQQLAFPRFNESIFQDPQISLVAPLMIPIPPSFVNLQLFIASAITVSIIYALLRIVLRRSTRNTLRQITALWR